MENTVFAKGSLQEEIVQLRNEVAVLSQYKRTTENEKVLRDSVEKLKDKTISVKKELSELEVLLSKKKEEGRDIIAEAKKKADNIAAESEKRKTVLSNIETERKELEEEKRKFEDYCAEETSKMNKLKSSLTESIGNVKASEGLVKERERKLLQGEEVLELLKSSFFKEKEEFEISKKEKEESLHLLIENLRNESEKNAGLINSNQSLLKEMKKNKEELSVLIIRQIETENELERKSFEIEKRAKEERIAKDENTKQSIYLRNLRITLETKEKELNGLSLALNALKEKNNDKTRLLDLREEAIIKKERKK